MREASGRAQNQLVSPPERPLPFGASVENVFDNDHWAGVASFGTLAWVHR
jgi:hypothetical protein